MLYFQLFPAPAEPVAKVEERQPWSLEVSPRDWTEDFSHENGNYNCVCTTCKKTFVGHKRRMTCKVCATPSPAPSVDMDQPATLGDVARMIEERLPRPTP